MSPSNWAVAADIPITMVKLPAAGVPTSAAGLAGLAATGLGEGVITGRALATLTGVMNDVLTPGMGPGVGGGASASGVTGDSCGGGVLAAGVPGGDLLGDGDGDAAAATDTVPAAAGIVVMAGLVVASAVAVRVTGVPELVPEVTWI